MTRIDHTPALARRSVRSLESFWSEDRSLAFLLVFLTVSIFVAIPLQQLGVVGGMTIAVVFSLILVSGVWTVSRRRSTARIVAMLAAASLVTRWATLTTDWPVLEMWDSLLSLVACGMLAVFVTMQVFRAGPITVARIQGAIAVYLLLGMIWAFAYQAVSIARPGAFSFSGPPAQGASGFLYFSFVALTTVGFGDVTAVDPIARSLVSLEALVGQLYPAILLARLVTMEHDHNKTRRSTVQGDEDPS